MQKSMYGFEAEKEQSRKQDASIKKFLSTDGRFQSKSPMEVAAFCRKTDIADSRTGSLHLPVTKDELFTKTFSDLQISRFWSEEGSGFEMGLGYWVVRVETHHRLKSIVPDWEIELMIGPSSRMAFPSVIRERVVRHLGEDTYEAWKAEVLGTESELRHLLTKVSLKMKRNMAASWVASPSSARLLKRVGIQMANDWAFFFRRQVF
jgi:hypothetical protein